MRREWETRVKESLTVATFLGGLTLAALTFIPQLTLPFRPVTFFSISITLPDFYKEILIGLAGVASSFLITSVFGLKTVLVREREEREFFSRLAVFSYEAGYLFLLLLLPFLVAPFSIYTVILISIIEGLWFIIIGKDKRSRETFKKLFSPSDVATTRHN
jgi:hypothetical protein